MPSFLSNVFLYLGTDFCYTLYMNISFNTNLDKENLSKLKRLYKKSFPKSELKPFSLIEKKVKDGTAEICGIFGDDIFSGLMINAKYGDIVLIDYLAIDPDFQNKGIGSTALKLLFEKYPSNRIILEIEATDIDVPDLENRKNRKNFYLRNGLKVMPYKVDLFGVEMEILTFGGDVDFKEYFSLQKHYLPINIDKKIILL